MSSKVAKIGEMTQQFVDQVSAMKDGPPVHVVVLCSDLQPNRDGTAFELRGCFANATCSNEFSEKMVALVATESERRKKAQEDLQNFWKEQANISVEEPATAKNPRKKLVAVEIKRIRAQNLLKKGKNPVAVSKLLGYSQPCTFYTTFKRWTGMTPGKYQKKHTKK